MNQINRIVKNKIEFTFEGKVLKGLVLKHFQRRPVDAQIYLVVEGNNLWIIHEILSHGIVINSEISGISSNIDLQTWYDNLQTEFNYVLVDETTS
jgi:hypothetical protein